MSWFTDNGIREASAGGGISQHQADTINRLMREGVPLAQIAAAVGLPASLIQQSTGYGMNGPNNQGGAEVEAPTAPTASTSASNDPIEFIRQWQKDHPQASQQAFYDLAAELKTRFGIERAQGGVGPSNNEFLINGQKVKAYSEGGNSWFDPGGLTPEGDYNPGGIGKAMSLADFNAPTYTYQPYQQPAPFSYDSYTPGSPFKAPTAEDVLSDPGVQFRLDEGRKALESSASARGTLLTGGTLKDVTNYGQRAASNEYGNAFNRAFNTWGANEDQNLTAYNTNRGNAYQNYAMNLGAGQTGYGLNANQSLAAFNANLNASQGAWDRNRLAGLDVYGQGQDYINNLFRYTGAAQGYTGVPYPTGTYV